MKPLILIPFHDPKWKQNAEENVRRQGLPALFIRNGEAARTPFELCINSEPGQAAALNAGVDWARKYGFTHALSLDSDDYYGPGYAQHVLPLLAQHDFIGRRQLFAELQDGIHWFFRHGLMFLFATMGFAIDKFIPVEHSLQNSDTWVRAMTAAGYKSADTGVLHYCYRRHGTNAHWSGAPDIVVRAGWGATRFYGKQPVEMVDAPSSVPWVPMPRPTIEDVAAYMRAELLSRPHCVTID